MTHSESLDQLFAALAAAQGEMDCAPKDHAGRVGDQKTRYADLASVREAIRTPLSKNKLAYSQDAGTDGAKVTVVTLLGHASGQWMRSSLTLTAANASPQAVGSAITYARRYGLSAMVGVAPDDDDGAAAQPQQRQAAPAEARREFGRAPAPDSGAVRPQTNADRVAANDAKLVEKRVAKTGELIAAIDKRFPRLAQESPGDVKVAIVEFAIVAKKRHGELLDSVEAAALEKKADWPGVCRLCNLPAGSSLDDLTPGQADAVLAFLQALPDAGTPEEEYA